MSGFVKVFEEHEGQSTQEVSQQGTAEETSMRFNGLGSSEEDHSYFPQPKRVEAGRLIGQKWTQPEQSPITSDTTLVYDWMKASLNSIYDSMSMLFLLKDQKEYYASYKLYIEKNSEEVAIVILDLISELPGFRPFKGAYAYYIEEGNLQGVSNFYSGGGDEVYLSFKGNKTFIEQCKLLVDGHPLTKRKPQVRRVTHDGQRFDNGSFKLVNVKPALADYYPYFNFTAEQLWDDFEKSSANVLLMIGDPGTGKSSFIRRMMDHRGYENTPYLVDNEALLLNPMLITYLQSQKDMCMLIAEDADNFVARREEHNQSMVGLLNMSSGVAAGETKIILSTNLPNINRVDPALIRPGRCFKVITFDKLSPEEATFIRAALGIEVEVVEPMTLAETLNPSNGSEIIKKSFGFNQ